jgi:hypothetical protein
MNYEQIFDVAKPEEWFLCLETYQKTSLMEMQLDVTQYEAIAEEWLNCNISQTAQFGTQEKGKIFLGNIKKEVIKFICDDNSYTEEKNKLKEQPVLNRTLVVSTMSAGIASFIGSNAALITPVIVLVLMAFGKMTKNALCNTYYIKDEIVSV